MEAQEVAGGRTASTTTAVLSPELMVAQRKLQQHRQAYYNQIKRSAPPVQHGRSKTPTTLPNHKTRPNSTSSLPAHLGWHSGPLTRAYRLAQQNTAEKTQPLPPSPLPQPPSAPSAVDHKHTLPETQTAQKATINLSPDIALAILREKLAAPGRVWLLLRHLDQNGRGWVTIETARHQLTNKQSPQAICGPRQLRNLLNAGDNIFWQRDSDRIWLKSQAKVAAHLQLTRLNGRSVQLPITTLLQSIGTVRAHLYATFHSSRSKPNLTNKRPQNRPISRQTLKKLTNTTRRTQRLYEKRARIKQQTNYALGSSHTPQGEQNLAWQMGQAYFRFNDYKGHNGQPGRTYLAWQLPNSYQGPHDINTKSHQRQLNRQLTDLLTIGITGNGKGVSATPDTETLKANDGDNNGSDDGYKKKLFFENGAGAAKQYNRQPQDLYWPSRTRNNGRCHFWNALPAQPVDNTK